MVRIGPRVTISRKGFMVIDIRGSKDIILEAYRASIGFLGFYREGYGSVTDGIAFVHRARQRQAVKSTGNL
jgi:hypothetical protein